MFAEYAHRISKVSSVFGRGDIGMVFDDDHEIAWSLLAGYSRRF